MNIKSLVHYYNQIPCSNCGCRETFDGPVTDRMDHIILEYEINCADCGKTVNYWAHGYVQGPETYTELLSFKWFCIKSAWLSKSGWIFRIERFKEFCKPCIGCKKRFVLKALTNSAGKAKCADCMVDEFLPF